MKKSRGVSKIAILIAVVILTGLGGVGYYFYSQNPEVSKSGGLMKNPFTSQETHEFDGQTLITGDDVRLPKDFPLYVPIYPEAKITTASYKNQSAHLQQTTSDGKDMIVEWYKNLAEKNEWKTDLDYDDTMMGYYTLSFSTNELVIGVSVQPDKESGEVLVVFNSTSKSDASLDQYGGEQTVGDMYEDGMQKLRDLESKMGEN